VIKKYEVLLFDLDNTLFDFEAAEKEALIATKDKLNLQLTYEAFHDLYQSVNKPLWEALERGEITSGEIKTERFIRLIEKLNSKHNPIEVSQFYTARLGEGVHPVSDALSVVEQLSSHYELVALTNGIQTVQESRMARSPIGKYFKHLIISEAVGYSKPEPEIFEKALSLVGTCEKTKVLMIGDSLKADIEGAYKFGIDAIWVNLKDAKSPENPTYIAQVNHLKDLLSILI